MQRAQSRPWLQTGIAVAIAVFVATRAARGFEARDLSRDSAAQTRTAAILAELPEGAVVFSTWTLSTLFWFHQWVDGTRPEIEIVNSLPSEWSSRSARYPGRPQFFERVPPGAPAERFVRFRGIYRRRDAEPAPGGH